MKVPNKVIQITTKEVLERRGLAKGNTNEQNVPRTQSRISTPSALGRVQEVATKGKGKRFTALLHHVNVERLRSVFHAMKKSAAPGIDGMTWDKYAENLDENIKGLNRRLHQGAYRARPSRRVYIPKADGRQRPLGIASLEDKIAQGAVVEVLNAIYEKDFLGFSYGFRPGRNQHQALDALYIGIRYRKVNWVLDADIRGFFDAINHEWMQKFLEHRIGDKRVLRLIQKWLNAGVMEEGKWAKSEVGSPQGATVSPLLANLYLHYAFDLWAHQWRQRQARGVVILVRYADDFVVGFQYRSDAERFRKELGNRLAKFKLELHPEKTRLIEFGRFARRDRKSRDEAGSPETFNFLGFTHICGRTRKGTFLLARHTMRKKMTAKLHDVAKQMQRRRHHSIADQGQWLRAVLRGYYAYYGVPTNARSLSRFRTIVARLWYRSLLRRSQRRRLNWCRMNRIVNYWLPAARITHQWPELRFKVTTCGKSPVR
jgi:group II intron reverse transcriptase/maturase